MQLNQIDFFLILYCQYWMSRRCSNDFEEKSKYNEHCFHLHGYGTRTQSAFLSSSKFLSVLASLPASNTSAAVRIPQRPHMKTTVIKTCNTKFGQPLLKWIYGYKIIFFWSNITIKRKAFRKVTAKKMLVWRKAVSN